MDNEIIAHVAEECIERWGEDVKTRDFYNKFREFIGQLNDDKKDLASIFVKLMPSFNYYSLRSIHKIFEEFYKKITYEYNLEEAYTVYSKIESSEKFGSSSFLLSEFCTINNISTNFCVDLQKIDSSKMKYIKNIVFFDDVIGSGGTVIKFLDKTKHLLNSTNLYIFCVEILEEGLENIKNYIESAGLKCKVIKHNVQYKAFKKDYIFSCDIEKTENSFREFELALWGKKNNYILGFKDSQALVAFYRNTPNNTLSSFWYDSDSWKSLFSRDNRKPVFMNSSERRKHDSNLLYNLKKAENK